MKREQLDYQHPSNKADQCRWSFLEKGINSVMFKLDDGVDMKTVRSSALWSIQKCPVPELT